MNSVHAGPSAFPVTYGEINPVHIEIKPLVTFYHPNVYLRVRNVKVRQPRQKGQSCKSESGCDRHGGSVVLCLDLS